MATSKLQRQTKERLRLLLARHRFIENYRPDWLKNPETGANLELDFWLPEVDVGIEVQGKQHQEFTPIFHKCPSDFEAQQYRDALKNAICQQRGVILYEVFCIRDIDTVIEGLFNRSIETYETLFGRNAAIKTLGYLAAEIGRLPKKPKTRRAARTIADRQESLLSRIRSIAEQHEIPFDIIKPDYTIKKVEMQFSSKPIVTVCLFDDTGAIRNKARGGIFYKNGNNIIIKWTKRARYTAELTEMEFDCATGWQVEDSEDGLKWRVKPEELPEGLEAQPDKPKRVEKFKVSQLVIWNGESAPDREHDFDIPAKAIILECGTRHMKIAVETQSGTPYRRWVHGTELQSALAETVP
jgi:hypothetical protein